MISEKNSYVFFQKELRYSRELYATAKQNILSINRTCCIEILPPPPTSWKTQHKN